MHSSATIAAAFAAAALIAGSGSGSAAAETGTRTPGADSEYVLPTPKVQRELVETIQALYGPRHREPSVGIARHRGFAGQRTDVR